MIPIRPAQVRFGKLEVDHESMAKLPMRQEYYKAADVFELAFRLLEPHGLHFRMQGVPRDHSSLDGAWFTNAKIKDRKKEYCALVTAFDSNRNPIPDLKFASFSLSELSQEQLLKTVLERAMAFLAKQKDSGTMQPQSITRTLFVKPSGKDFPESGVVCMNQEGRKHKQVEKEYKAAGLDQLPPSVKIYRLKTYWHISLPPGKSLPDDKVLELKCKFESDVMDYAGGTMHVYTAEGLAALSDLLREHFAAVSPELSTRTIFPRLDGIWGKEYDEIAMQESKSAGLDQLPPSIAFQRDYYSWDVTVSAEAQFPLEKALELRNKLKPHLRDFYHCKHDNGGIAYFWEVGTAEGLKELSSVLREHLTEPPKSEGRTLFPKIGDPLEKHQKLIDQERQDAELDKLPNFVHPVRHSDYWEIRLPVGMKLSPEKALELNRKMGQEVRAYGRPGGIDEATILEYMDFHKGVNLWAVDTPKGLMALSTLLHEHFSSLDLDQESLAKVRFHSSVGYRQATYSLRMYFDRLEKHGIHIQIEGVRGNSPKLEGADMLGTLKTDEYINENEWYAMATVYDTQGQAAPVLKFANNCIPPLEFLETVIMKAEAYQAKERSKPKPAELPTSWTIQVSLPKANRHQQQRLNQMAQLLADDMETPAQNLQQSTQKPKLKETGK